MKEFFIIGSSVPKRGISFSRKPVVHEDYDEAVKEAERLTRRHHKRFIVFSARGITARDPLVYFRPAVKETDHVDECILGSPMGNEAYVMDQG